MNHKEEPLEKGHHEEEHDALWELLGQARPTEVSPYFSRNVLRTLRQSQASRRAPWPALLRWLLPASALAALLLGWTAMQWNQHEKEQAFAEAFNAAANLSSLVAVDQRGPWMEVN